MTPLQAEALLVRHQAAMKQLNTTGVLGRVNLLAQIINPSDLVLDASMEVAEGTGPSALALKMSLVAPVKTRRARAA